MRDLYLRFYLVLCLIIPTAVQANWTVNSTPVSVTGGSINSSGQVVSMATYQATHPTKGTLYMDRLTTYNKATTGTLAKRRIIAARSNLNPLGLLMTGTLIGVGYFLDSVTGDIYSQAPENASCGTGTAQTCINLYGGGWGGSYNDCQVVKTNVHCFQSLAIAANAATAKYNNMTWQAGKKPFTCVGNAVANNGVQCIAADGSNYYVNANYNTVNFPLTRNIPGIQATPDEVHDKIFPPVKWDDAGYLGDHLPELLRDPVTNSPVKTQETANKAKEIENATNTAENPAYEPTPVESVPSPSENTNAVATTWPTFCAWAIPVCALVDWMMEDDSTEPDPNEATLPETQLTYETPVWSSGLGNGSCPAPASFSVFNNQFNFSFEPFCDLAGMIRYLVLLLAYISSALIISGVRR